MNSEQFLHWLKQSTEAWGQADCFKKPLVMGILNLTPDSFSDAGSFVTVESASARALDLIDQGVDIIDLGAESTRPGSIPVPSEVELERLLPVLDCIRRYSDICISVDTYKPEVMRASIDAGAQIINDVYALQAPGALEMAAQLKVPVCLMHMQGEPRTMQVSPQYQQGVLAVVLDFFRQRVMHCEQAGIERSNLILDPGFGFGKNLGHNMQIMRHISCFKQFHCPLLLGVSRKSAIGAVLNQPVGDRLIGSIALAVFAAMQGVCILRVHDVEETIQALNMIEALYLLGADCGNDLVQAPKKR